MNRVADAARAAIVAVWLSACGRHSGVDCLERGAAVSSELTRLRREIASPRVVLIDTDLATGMSSVVGESVGPGQRSAFEEWQHRRVDAWYLELIRSLPDATIVPVFAEDAQGQLAALYRANELSGSFVLKVLQEGDRLVYLSANRQAAADMTPAAHVPSELYIAKNTILDIIGEGP